jgi:hypothetical protein
MAPPSRIATANVVTIADEVDAQLKQQMLRFMAADAMMTTCP